MSNTIIVLAMHGAPPRDFDRQELAEFFGLHSRLQQAGAAAPPELRQRHDALEARMRAWPRSAANDPFWAASHELGAALSHATGRPVLVGFNEFCGPSLDEALDQAASHGAEEVVVVTPMMTRGGEHAEIEIPEAVKQAGLRHPAVGFRFAWPFPAPAVAGFLAQQIGLAS